MSAGTLLMLLLACWTLLLAVAPASAAAPTYADPEYTYHIAMSQSLASQSLPADLQWSRSSVSDVDDCYFETIDLAFAFPYWLRSFRTLSISPNGALYIPPDVVGCTCRTYINGIVSPTFMVAVPCQCCFDNAFFDLIAASLTDLFPVQNPPSATMGIYWAQTNTSFFARYESVPLYTDQWNVATQGPVPTQSFTVELRSNGRIITRYTHIDDVFTYGNYVQDRGTWIPRTWMVALRQADPRFPTTFNPSSRVTRNKAQWNATVNAVYPPRAAIRSGSTINYWPMGSVACNSPSIGTPSRTDTWIYLNDFARRAANFDLRCWVSVSSVTVGSVPAFWNATLGALKCTLPSHPASTVLTINLAEAEDGIFLPLTAMSFSIYADADPVILRYDVLALATRTGGGPDLRICYECARLRPQLCQAPLLTSMCNTPQIGSTDGTTPTVVIPSGYSWSDRMASGALKNLWCVWSDPDAVPDARDPNGLNPFLFNVTWVAARLYSNASGWVVCDPPILSEPAGTVYNLSLAEGNFVWGGGIGAVGGGWGYASPLDDGFHAEMAANTRAAMVAAAGNKHLLLSYTLVLPGDARLLAYETADYLDDYLLASSSNFSAGVGSKAGLNLKQLCADCRSRVASLAADSSTAASSLTGANGVCLDAAAASVNLCLSPPFGDAAGATVAGPNATFNLFLSNYPTHIRRQRFALSCALQPFYIRNDSSVANVTVVNGTQSYVELRTTYHITYFSVGTPTFVPLLFDASRSLYSCEAPSLASLNLGALTALYANVSLDSVQVQLAENNLVLPGFPRGVVYTYIASGDARLEALELGRQTVPQSPPWSFCFSCDPLFRSVSFTPNAGFITDSRGLSYCFGTAAVSSLPAVRICASPSVGGKQALLSESNNTVSLWTTSLYPLATRVVMSSVYCVFALPPTYTTTFNATTNVSTTVRDEPAIPPLWVPVSYRSAEQRSATCVPPVFGGAFGSAANLTVGIAEFGLLLPFAPQTYRFLDESEEDLVILRQHQALMTDGSTFSPQQFCTDCHATAVLAGPTFVPFSPVGAAGLCYADCALRWNGAAVYDDCGVCSAGHSSHTFNSGLDCLGVCSGPFRTQPAGLFEDCRCETRPECFNISTQPLVGVSILPTIPGRPRATPLDQAAVSSQQYLLRTFPLGLGLSGLVINDASASLTPDPDFNSTGFLRFSPSNWLGSGDGSGFAADPYPIAVGFSFPFFERVYSTIYLSSSGALMFAPQASYPEVCKRAPSDDPRVHNLGLLAALFAAPGDFATGCADASAILAYATYLDPSANISSPFPGAFALGAMPTQTPAATVAYMVGPAASAATSDAAAVAAGQWISFKFENVPYNFPAFAPWAARYASAPAVADTKPPLYSFQITLYASGRISLKYLAVTDPADPAAVPAFNTTDGFKSLIVGLIDRKLPSSSLTQSAPQDSYVVQLERGQGASFGLQGALALRTRQHQWLPNSSVSIGVFPPRAAVASAIQQVLCPFALNACAYPPAGPSTGGTLVSVSLFNLGVDRGCIERLLSIQCVFGDVATPSQSTYDPLTTSLHCLSPAGTALVTVPLLLMEGNSTLITTNKLFWSWFAPGDTRLDVHEYDEIANTTWTSHIAGLGETAGVAFAQTVGSYQREMCAACHAFNPGYCIADCNQVYFGTAFVDDCGNCTAGQTRREPNFARDCGGVCSGLSQLVPSPSGGDPQCVCAPLQDPLCGASAIPAMNPAPSQPFQFVYNVRAAASAPATSGPMEPLSVDWDGMPSGSIEVVSPLPEYLSVPLPFLFPFYAQLLSSVHISGWGALLLEEISDASLRTACLSRGFEALFRNTSTTLCPFQLIAGSLMEYDLSAAGSSLKYYPSAADASRSACFTVVWKNMVAASDASLHYSFAVQLCDAGQVTLSYREVHDPSASARAVALLPPVKFVPTATVALPPAPAYALSPPFWLAGVMQSWSTASIFHLPGVAAPVLRNADGSALTLSRENVVPFPFSQTQNTLAVIEQRAFLGLSGPASPLGTFPSRAQLHTNGTGSQWQYCRLGVDFCASVTWGPVEGGTVVRIFGTDWGCRSFGRFSNQTRCCAEQLELECDFGGVRVPANFSSVLQAVQCVSPPAVLANTTVVLSLSDGGRRIGMRQSFVFSYNVTAAELAAPSSADLVDHAQWYNTDSSICAACRSIFSPTLLGSDAFCATDCYGEFRGGAALDGCGVCAGGSTGLVAEANRDCRGECFGPFRKVLDSDAPLLQTATSQVRASLAGQCICIDSSAIASGLPSCGYYPVLDGPIQASQVFRFAEYEFFLVAMAVSGLAAAAAWAVVVAMKAGGAAAPAGAAAQGAAAQPPPPPPAPSQQQRRAQRAVAAGLMGVAGGLVPDPAASAAAPAPAAAEPAAAAAAPSRRRAAAAAAAASPAMSGAASAALGGGSSAPRPARAHPPPAAHYQYSAAPRE